MQTMIAVGFGGYESLKLVDAPRPEAADGAVRVRVTAAGVTPLEHTILSGGHSRAKAPLMLGSESASATEEAGTSGVATRSRVTFAGNDVGAENGSWQDYLIVCSGVLVPIPDGISLVLAASVQREPAAQP